LSRVFWSGVFCPEREKLPFPSFSLFFAKGLGKPLSKASSGQASDEWGASSSLLGGPPCDGNNLLDPKEVLANEAFPRDSPRPDFLGTLDRPSPLFVPGWFKKLGVGKQGKRLDTIGVLGIYNFLYTVSKFRFGGDFYG
jgi:hypothetical protein